MKYAIYVVIVEDTEENDLAFGDFPAEDVNRAVGDLDMDDAVELAKIARADIEHASRQ
jgi:hypothetical protein